MGYKALFANTTGATNTALGKDAMYTNTTGDENTAVGIDALTSNTTGDLNVAVGAGTGVNVVANTTGAYNVFVGSYAHGTAVDVQHAISLGYNVGCDGSSLTFGEGATDTKCSNGSTSWSNPSDERLKKDITTSTAGLGFINDLRPVTFKWKNEGDIPSDFSGYVEGSTVPFKNSLTEHGFIAQEVKTVIDAHSELKDGFDMWKEDEKDGRQRIGDGALIPMLVKAIQELDDKIVALTARVTTLE